MQACMLDISSDNMEFQAPRFKYSYSSEELKLHNCLLWHFELHTCDKLQFFVEWNNILLVDSIF